MDLTKRIQEKDRADKLGNNDTSAEDQKYVNEVSYFDQHTKYSKVKTLLQATVGILQKSKASKFK